MKIKCLYSITALMISFSSSGQVIAYFNGGIAGNSGALVYPYEKPDPYISIPSFLGIDLEYQLSDKFKLSVFAIRKINTKDGDLFSGIDVDSKSYYYGVKYGIRMPNNLTKRSSINLGVSAAYGREFLSWKDSGGLNLIGGSSTTTGNDQFKLAQIGLFATIKWEFKRLITLISFEPTKDFVLTSKRNVTYTDSSDTSEYEIFKYKGTFSANLKLGLGIKLFKY